jgi:proteasome lid subunit RPN8/RPN11
MRAALFLPNDLRAQILREARAAFPKECCGLVEGTHNGDAIRVEALHATRNLATRDDRFEIDPAEQFRLMRVLRGTGRAIVGCYHSHPNGRATPSEHDLGFEAGFVWLIAALGGAADETALAAFVIENNAFAPLALHTLDPGGARKL